MNRQHLTNALSIFMEDTRTIFKSIGLFLVAALLCMSILIIPSSHPLCFKIIRRKMPGAG